MKIEVTMENGCYSECTNGGRIYTSGGYFYDNGGGSISGDTKEEVIESIKVRREIIEKEGNTLVIIDKTTTKPKGKLEAWMGTPKTEEKELKVKFELMWRFNRGHKKRHYVLKWCNFDEFDDMIGKKGYVSCCNWNHTGWEADECRELDHEVRPMEIAVQKWLEENELNCDWEIGWEGFEKYSSSQGRWDIIGDAGVWYKKLVEHCGFEEHMGFSVHSVKDIQALYRKSKNKVQCKIYLKKCTALWYENECREASENGDFIKGFTPHKHDIGAKNTISIKNWLDKLQ